MQSNVSPITGELLMKTMTIQLAVALALTVGAASVNASTVILETSQASSFGSKSFSGSATWTDRKFNRMRPSMARVLGLETRSAKEG